ncbi:uncharacterized protein I206_106396 [Kwoniella pini CBS 10737]|uniref:Uncharacterized protein n=1 Tax=Kwoniella pini CBS 10737 TaxID=1296096 RepID=A0A1B9HU69_9TREE|nr:uncharacterized protein I206_07200 [Kwoniella pini CBS 10737]OCF46813.1 hypothetical protein I206_07200 [Kwoniella pini CBS 10737]
MPKHLPTFKHLLHSSQPTQKKENKEKSVNDLLSSSRNARPVIPSNRDLPPHITSERIWTPSNTSSSGGLVEVEQGGIHPAEILRRSNIAQRQASRYIAGPAPPPSWRSNNLNASSSSSSSTKVNSFVNEIDQPVTTSQLESSSKLLSFSNTSKQSQIISQKNSLVENCFKTILKHLKDDQIIYISEDEKEIYTLSKLLKEQIPFLSIHLKSYLLNISSNLPSNHPYRLNDDSFLAILNNPIINDKKNLNNNHSNLLNEIDWDNNPLISEPIINHLSITLNSLPFNLLFKINNNYNNYNYNLNSIISLNLSYSILPFNSEKFINILPFGLKELSLVGIKIDYKNNHKNNDNLNEDNIRRNFNLLGKRLIVLQILDLSFPRFNLTNNCLEALLSPPKSKLPSLRKLGLRGLTDSEDQTHYSQDKSELDKGECYGKDEPGSGIRISKELVNNLIKTTRRNRYVEVVWQ